MPLKLILLILMTLHLLPPTLAPIIDTGPKVVPVDSFTMLAQSFPEVVVHLPHVRPNRNCKST